MRSRTVAVHERRLPEASLRHDKQVLAWVRRLAGDPDAVPSDLSPQKLKFVMEEVMKRRGEPYDHSLYEKHMERLRPALAVPAVTDRVEDMRATFAMGEIREFWSSWTGRRGDRGPSANVAGAKALMATMAVPGITTHAIDAHELLDTHPGLQSVFAELPAEKGEPGAAPDPAPFTVPGYSSALRIAHQIAPGARWSAMRAAVSMVRSLREIPGFEQAGKRLLIDGTSIVAWAPQRGSGPSPEREAALRQHAPEAGFRSYQYTAGGKVEAKKVGDRALATATRHGKGKMWRGYFLVVIADQLTGMPLVWLLMDAAEDEADALVPLLRDLHELWPDIDADVIAGDSAWDEDWACRVCEVEYRIRPVFRRNPKPAPVRGKEAKAKRSHVYAFPQGTHRQVVGRLHNGQLVCRCGTGLPYKKFDRAPLDGLRPGQPARPEGGFKLRGECPRCGVVAVQASADWSSLTYYPHHRHGRPDLYAARQALLHHLGQVEAIFASLKGAHGQGTPGADRGRIRQRRTHEALISLALVFHVALTVCDQRTQRNLPLDPDAVTPASTPPASEQPPANDTATNTAETPTRREANRRAQAAGGPPPRPIVRAVGVADDPAADHAIKAAAGRAGEFIDFADLYEDVA